MASRPSASRSHGLRIKDVQARIAEALEALVTLDRAGNLPSELRPLVHYLAPKPGHRPGVSLRYTNTERKIRETAGADYWDPTRCAVVIQFQDRKDMRTSVEESPRDERDSMAGDDPQGRVEDIVRALDLAERSREFVALKWFRDTFLTGRGYSWSSTTEARQAAIVEILSRGWARTQKVPNPRNPSFPTTTIHLNRSIPAVRDLLTDSVKPRWDFDPVTIKGEPLSRTVIEGRR